MDKTPKVKLTAHQSTVMRLIASGLSDSAIATLLNISVTTVWRMVKLLYRKHDLPKGGKEYNPRVLLANIHHNVSTPHDGQ